MVKVKLGFTPSLSPDSVAVVSEATKNALSVAAEFSNNPQITITSTIRTPQKQAQAMYDNLERGIRIRYAAPGREVIAVYDELKAKKLSRDEIITAMVKRIIMLSLKGQRVSKHCVSSEQYSRLNIVDISPKMPNPRDMVKELAANPKVKKVITPFHSNYGSEKVSVDASEPAIHVEIEQ